VSLVGVANEHGDEDRVDAGRRRDGRGDVEPVTRCTKVSAGCDHCYAETFAERWRGISGHPFEHGFDVTLRPGRIDQPLR
jgi:hypothetical protein